MIYPYQKRNTKTLGVLKKYSDGDALNRNGLWGGTITRVEGYTLGTCGVPKMTNDDVLLVGHITLNCYCYNAY